MADELSSLSRHKVPCSINDRGHFECRRSEIRRVGLECIEQILTSRHFESGWPHNVFATRLGWRHGSIRINREKPLEVLVAGSGRAPAQPADSELPQSADTASVG